MKLSPLIFPWNPERLAVLVYMVAAGVFLLVGVVLMRLQRRSEPGFWQRKPELPSDDVAAGLAIAEGALVEED